MHVVLVYITLGGSDSSTTRVIVLGYYYNFTLISSILNEHTRVLWISRCASHTPWIFTILRNRQRYISTTTYFNSLFSWFFFLLLFFFLLFKFHFSTYLIWSYSLYLCLPSVCPLFACLPCSPCCGSPWCTWPPISDTSATALLRSYYCWPLSSSLPHLPIPSSPSLPLLSHNSFFSLLILSFLPSSNSPFFSSWFSGSLRWRCLFRVDEVVLRPW